MASQPGKLNRRQEAAISFLLSEPTVRQAATAAGVGYSTLKAWMADATFAAAYRAARAELVDEAVAALQRASAEAVQTLQRNLTCSNTGVQVRAARTILEMGLKMQELVELEARIAEVEARLEGGT